MLGLPPRILGATLTVPVVLALIACSDVGARAPASPAPTTSSSVATSPSAIAAPDEQQCVDETLDQPREDAVVGADLAAWLIEDQLPPPLRVSGLHSGTTAILLDGEPVGQVRTEEVDDSIFRVTVYTFCVPADVVLTRIDVEATLGGEWRLVEATPDLGLPADAEMSLTITGDTVGGWAVCNEYQGFVAAGPDSTWRISRLLFTEAFCGDAEGDYFDTFGATTSWSLDSSELVLDGPAGTLRYKSVSP